MPQQDLALLLRLNKSWHDGISAENLYEITRAWWVMSPANAQRVARVLAVAGGVVREVYQPMRWLPSPVEGLENRIGFEGVVAADRDRYVGRDVTHLFRHGSANPVRYLPLDALAEDAAIAQDPAPKAPSAGAGRVLDGAVEPGLLERIVPLLDAFQSDLLWAQSRAGQELFHSNTIAWLLRKFPVPCAPLLDLLGAARYDGVSQVGVWRERRHLDIVVDPVGASPKVVVENKLYSVPYPAQLSKYNGYPLPWSLVHGEDGAPATRYVLLSLMTPSFPLPRPWVHVDYQDLAAALDQIDADALGRTSGQFARYRALTHRLVALAEAVDPAQALDEQFSATDVVARLPGGGLDGAIARMRFSGLAQVIQTHFEEPKSFEVGGDRGGLVTYWRRLSDMRRIGWQFQENQLRFFITVEDPDLQGQANRPAREEIIEAEHADFFDHADIEAILGPELKAKSYAPGEWLGFNPDFVYRHRPVKPSVSTARLAQALAAMTERVDHFADKAGHDKTQTPVRVAMRQESQPMPSIGVVLGDITTVKADAIVNAANRRVRGGGGVDGAIHRAGGPAILVDCVARFPDGLATGDAGWTTAGKLPARWVIHTVGPNYSAGQQDRSLLTSCYRRALGVADELGARSVAFPLISAGIYGWPKRDAIAAAVETIAATLRRSRPCNWSPSTSRRTRRLTLGSPAGRRCASSRESGCCTSGVITAPGYSAA